MSDSCRTQATSAMCGRRQYWRLFRILDSRSEGAASGGPVQTAALVLPVSQPRLYVYGNMLSWPLHCAFPCSEPPT